MDALLPQTVHQSFVLERANAMTEPPWVAEVQGVADGLGASGLTSVDFDPEPPFVELVKMAPILFDGAGELIASVGDTGDETQLHEPADPCRLATQAVGRASPDTDDKVHPGHDPAGVQVRPQNSEPLNEGSFIPD